MFLGEHLQAFLLYICIFLLGIFVGVELQGYRICIHSVLVDTVSQTVLQSGSAFSLSYLNVLLNK